MTKRGPRTGVSAPAPSVGPRPGAPVRGSRTGRPVMALLDLLGRRWALRVLWELSQATEPLAFREIQERCAGMSSSVLSTRLGELREAGLIVPAARGYELTEQGRSLLDALQPVSAWAARWVAEAER
jgi:DNA-binding HxlR family transcriptional regulator